MIVVYASSGATAACTSAGVAGSPADHRYVITCSSRAPVGRFADIIYLRGNPPVLLHSVVAEQNSCHRTVSR